MSPSNPGSIQVDNCGAKDNPGRWLVQLLLCVSVGFAIYVLSVGPVVKLRQHLIIRQRWLLAYDPLFRFTAKFQPLRNARDWYIFDVWKCDRDFRGIHLKTFPTPVHSNSSPPE